jgi:hypothetical protein
MDIVEIFLYGFAIAFGSGIVISFFRMVSALFGEEKS